MRTVAHHIVADKDEDNVKVNARKNNMISASSENRLASKALAYYKGKKRIWMQVLKFLIKIVLHAIIFLHRESRSGISSQTTAPF